MTLKSKPLSHYIEVKGRFRRSTNLEKDFAATPNGNYLITPTARDALRRMAEGMSVDFPSQAWTLTGPYGVGKSAFAVFLTRLLCGDGKQRENARAQLKQIDPVLTADLRDAGLFSMNSKGFLPVLATARRTSASRCLAEGIVEAAASFKRPEPPIRDLRAKLKSQENGYAWDTRLVVDAVASLSKMAGAAGYQGILVVIDELGKLFEHAARHPQKGEVFLLQELAEQASRSAGTPIVLVGLLHQSFQEYGLRLDKATRREWEKIQGRFEDIAFLEPAEQVVRLIAQAIEWKPSGKAKMPAEFARHITGEASKAGVIPPGMQASDFLTTVQNSYPLHPVTLVALPFVFRRFAQNERSLFSYLSSFEPYGFQEFIKAHPFTPEQPPVIRLSDLFDYFTRNFGAGLYRHPQALRWMEAADALERKGDLPPLHRDVVKSVGMLNALGEFCHLNATEGIISLAVTDSAEPSDELRQALASLKEASIITFRKFNHTYRIWEGSDVDIEERIAEGERKMRHGHNLAGNVQRFLPNRPLVARRHAFETGALRYFEVEYLDDPRETGSGRTASEADGKVLVCLAESPAVAEQFRALAMAENGRTEILFAIPQFIGELRAIVTELGALRWAWENTPALRDDRVARREISLRITEADQMLRRNLDGLLDPRDEPVGSGCLWIHRGEVAPVHSPVDVSQLLSDVCDNLYKKAPRIRNELIVKRSVSSAASAARRNLIERMLKHHDQETLGIEGYPPERSIYESVLRASGLHGQDKAGNWRFQAPDKHNATNIRAAWDCLDRALFGERPEPVPLDDLFHTLASPPYGVMPGLHPVLLCVFLFAHADETTLYREGSFLPEPGIADFEVLLRRPELFAVAGSRVSGGREAIVLRLAKGLKVPPGTVPVVRALFRMIRTLPDFAWNTRRLPQTSLALRKAFENARSPEKFLFVTLPESLGLQAFSEEEPDRKDIDTFFNTLNDNLRHLSEATKTAINAARDALLIASGFKEGQERWTDLRNAAITLKPAVTEPQLLAFLRRVAQSPPDASGVEAVLALVANRPPRNWSDADVDRFPEAAKAVGDAFRRAARSVGVARDADAQLASLTPKEWKQAETAARKMRTYLKENVKEVTARALRAAITKLLEELPDE